MPGVEVGVSAVAAGAVEVLTDAIITQNIEATATGSWAIPEGVGDAPTEAP
jgi:hypothetical protein